MQKKLKFIEEKIAGLPKKKMDQKELDFVAMYLGSSRAYLGIKTGDLVKVAKEIAKTQDTFGTDELIALLNKLFNSKTFEEYIIGGKIFTFIKPENRAKIPFQVLGNWLIPAKGWLEVDVICQSAYTGKEILDRWGDWAKTIKKFSKSEYISVRRASLVLQVKPVREISDEKLRMLAFETIERLKGEKEVLITKAVSWLLRGLSDLNKEEVKNYILKNEATLPRIAVRETLKKIETGTKNNRKLK